MTTASLLDSRRRTAAWAAGLAVAAASLAACSDAGTETGTVKTDTKSLFRGLEDGAVGGTGAKGDAVDGVGPQPSDGGLGDGTASGNTAIAGPLDGFVSTCPGGAGCPCAENQECDSGYCIDAAAGAQCAQKCTEKCPAGSKCLTVAVGSDSVTICVPEFAKLCNPCAASKECEAIGETDAFCVDHGPAGSFCGVACADDSQCPADFACIQAQTIEGAAAKQCVPKHAGGAATPGACGCSKSAVAKKLATPCWVTAAGSGAKCLGSRACGPDGLAPCSAAKPAAETCDGQDNDCDGQTDEGGCDDGKPCTNDNCDPGAANGEVCTHVLSPGVPCDDGTACTDGDICDEVGCKGKPKSCDDGDACTDSSCEPVVGCQFKPQSGPCNDGSACTTVDVCKGGVCTGKSVACDDGIDCTDDACLPAGGCKHTNNAAACDADGSVCTVGDGCVAGKCKAGKALACNDGNPCTQDACDPAVGCSAVPGDGACDDGEPCSEGDACAAGKCAAGAPKPCDDGNPCTVNGCQKGEGCTAKPQAGVCSDGNACTQNDVCSKGVCMGKVAIPCDDGNPCTDSQCDAGAGCKHVDNAVACDDGDPCSVGDKCGSGSCQAGAAKDCSGFGNACNAGVCQGGQCSQQPKAGACDDGNGCTVGDACAGGACQPGSAKDCSGFGDACNTGTCQGGGCVKQPKGGACNDGNPCTLNDQCSGGTCTGQGGGGVCTPNQKQMESQACGLCGTQTRSRTCGSTCGWGAWSDWGACGGQGVCSAGTTETQNQGCGNCGTQSRKRTCAASCQWGGWPATWGACTSQGVCNPGATQGCGTEPCAVNTCTGSCQWSGCKIKGSAACLWQDGKNFQCCGAHKWQYCSPLSCDWFPCQSELKAPYACCAAGVKC